VFVWSFVDFCEFFAGFLPALLAPIIGIAGSLIGELVESLIPK